MSVRADSSIISRRLGTGKRLSVHLTAFLTPGPLGGPSLSQAAPSPALDAIWWAHQCG